MAVTNALFIFEVVVENVQSFVKSRYLIIRSDFAEIFSLELKDPKQMNIVIPEPPPLPPEPPGKKKKKAKPKKPKKGKKGVVQAPPPEPNIQSGQSVLFTSNAQFLIQSMNKFPMEVSLWSKEDSMVYIGGCFIPWDPMFLTYLNSITEGITPPPITLNEEYNVFEEGVAKIMAKIKLQIKLSFLGDKCVTSFRTLSEDPNVKKVLYTGINSKTTSYMCTLKTTDEEYEANCNKIVNNYTVDKSSKIKPITYADFKNAPAANLTFFKEDDLCCMGQADKPPESIYKAPETCPDINFIIDYVRKIIVSCNDNMRMLTPRPTIYPRVKATDIDRLCYCKETAWPGGQLAEQFREEVQSGPCPVCISDEKKAEESRAATFDLANIRGPCGKPECKVARELRSYIENLVNEDKTEIDINEIIGPCGSKACSLAEKIQEFLRKEGVFNEGNNLQGLSTQCACVQKMRDTLRKKTSCHSLCSKDCDDSDSDAEQCEGKDCPFTGKECHFSTKQKTYDVYYFTVEHDFDKVSSISPSQSSPTGPSRSPSNTNTDKSLTAYKYCSTDCPSVKSSARNDLSCSRSVCTDSPSRKTSDSKCRDPVCPEMSDYPPSPADSNVVIQFDDIHNPCCVKSCGVADKVKDFIADAVMNGDKKKHEEDGDPCFCDCVCTFKFSKKTTYCAVCGGYECLGDDMRDQPPYVQPHPCPVYNKLYDKMLIKTVSPWPEEEKKPEPVTSAKSSKTGASKSEGASDRKLNASRSLKSFERGSSKKDNSKKQLSKNLKNKSQKSVGKFTSKSRQSRIETEPQVTEEAAVVEKKPEAKYPYPHVPKHMGWNWTAEDIPGMKPRPMWKPGAVNKFLLRMYRSTRSGGDVIAKKKRAMMKGKKKPEPRPTIVVTKRDGEYTVHMQVFKEYTESRLISQNPYDESKPPLIYTIGKTEEEKIKIQRQRERKERRETRRKSRLLQSTFRDRCQEICLKAYNQAIGVLPPPNPNNPDCPCQTTAEPNVSPPVDSCSCSEEDSMSESDTDNDEWTVEFSPPAARYQPKVKPPPHLVEQETQYTYLDYRVKLLDKFGNQVPRFFRGPDGKQECSDLGGFWNPEHIWLEINKDGFIGPDNRWAPMNFYGPDGMYYTAEEGHFTDSSGQHLRLGVDGWIDKDLKWVWYPRKPKPKSTKSYAGSTMKATKIHTPGGRGDHSSPVDHYSPTGGGSRTLQKTQAIGKPSAHPAKKPAVKIRENRGNAVAMSASINYDRSMSPPSPNVERLKGDTRRIAKYKEIMQGLQTYEDFYDLKPLMKTNRACNTLRRNTVSPYAMFHSTVPVRSITRNCIQSSNSSRS